MPRKTDYLEFHRGRYRVVVAVPRDLHDVLGTKLKRPLATDSLTTANGLKWPIVAEFKQQIEKARGGTITDPLRIEAEELRLAMVRARDEETRDALDEAIALRAEEIAGPPVGSVSSDHHDDQVHDPKRWEQAQRFMKMARGEATPLDAFVTTFNAEKSRTVAMMADDKRSMDALTAWCREAGVPPFIEEVTVKVAGRFVSEALFPSRSPKTVNKYVSSLSAYWVWLLKKGIVETNPWHLQSVDTSRSTDDEKQRTFTDEEIVKLLNGPAKDYMRPLMMLGALTGARIDAIVSLKVRDTMNGKLVFKRQKKEKGRRTIPTHSLLLPVIAQLTEGKAGDDDLFPELPPPPPGSERQRSNPAVQRFRTYRISVGVDDTVQGKRTSRITFHSFRRWFITKAVQAGIAPHIVSFVVGQKPPGMTLGVYTEGASWEQMVECVEAVRLPDGVVCAAPENG